MDNIFSYLENYGSRPFEEFPFNEIDALIFSQLCYIDYSAIVCRFDDDVQITLSDAQHQFFRLHTEEEIETEISIVSKAIELLRQCAQYTRYKNVILLKYANNVDDKIDKQFCAVTFYINQSLALIAFKGTDTSITGVKESAMLSYMFPVPAQIHALYYFQESGMLANRDLIICGHSKGGNLATFAGVSCSNSLKKRIIGIYEFDAPGFPEEMINRYDYIGMKDRIYSYIPQSSIIGCMLYHNSSRKIVESTNENIKQHQVSSWIIENNHFKFTDETDDKSKFVDKYLKQLTNQVGAENIEEVFETVFDFIENSGIKSYDDLKAFDAIRFVKVLSSLKNINEKQRDLIEDTIKQAVKELSRMMYEEGRQSINKKFANLVDTNKN